MVQASIIEETTLRGWKPAEISEQEKNEKRKQLEQQVMETIAQLNQARRPVLLAGNGIRLSEGRDEFEKLVEDFCRIPGSFNLEWN